MTAQHTAKDLRAGHSRAPVWRSHKRREAVYTNRSKLCTWTALWVKQTWGSWSPWIHLTRGQATLA